MRKECKGTFEHWQLKSLKMRADSGGNDGRQHRKSLKHACLGRGTRKWEVTCEVENKEGIYLYLTSVEDLVRPSGHAVYLAHHVLINCRRGRGTAWTEWVSFHIIPQHQMSLVGGEALENYEDKSLWSKKRMPTGKSYTCISKEKMFSNQQRIDFVTPKFSPQIPLCLQWTLLLFCLCTHAPSPCYLACQFCLVFCLKLRLTIERHGLCLCLLKM